MNTQYFQNKFSSVECDYCHSITLPKIGVYNVVDYSKYAGHNIVATICKLCKEKMNV